MARSWRGGFSFHIGWMEASEASLLQASPQNQSTCCVHALTTHSDFQGADPHYWKRLTALISVKIPGV